VIYIIHVYYTRILYTYTMDGIVNKVQSLCTPALVYFIISVISIFGMLFDNLENTNQFCFGNVSCNVANTSTIFIVHILFFIFWTWLLNFICSRGYKNVAWFILLFPYILLMLILLFGATEIRNTHIQNKESTPVVIAPNNDGFISMRY
jgi:amino acid transporter